VGDRGRRALWSANGGGGEGLRGSEKLCSVNRMWVEGMGGGGIEVHIVGSGLDIM